MSLHVVVKLACNIIKKNEDRTSVDKVKPWRGRGFVLIVLTGFEAVVAGSTDARAGWRSLESTRCDPQRTKPKLTCALLEFHDFLHSFALKISCLQQQN